MAFPFSPPCLPQLEPSRSSLAVFKMNPSLALNFSVFYYEILAAPFTLTPSSLSGFVDVSSLAQLLLSTLHLSHPPTPSFFYPRARLLRLLCEILPCDRPLLNRATSVSASPSSSLSTTIPFFRTTSVPVLPSTSRSFRVRPQSHLDPPSSRDGILVSHSSFISYELADHGVCISFASCFS